MQIEQHPILAEHGTFGEHRLGKREPKIDARTLMLTHYLAPAVLPTVPEQADYSKGVKNWPMYGNDRLGDCTVAAAAHQVQAWSHAAGRTRTPAAVNVDRMYWMTGNPPSQTGVPGGETDTGRYELDILNYWTHVGLGPDKLTAYAAINPKDQATVQAGVYLLGGVYCGIWLPLTAQTQSVWDVVGDGSSGPSKPGSWGGHAVPILGYDALGVILVTWGYAMRATWRFLNRYMDEAYGLVSQDFLKAGKSPQGFDVAALETDLAALRRH